MIRRSLPNFCWRRSCIALSAIGDSIVENISFSDVHLTFGGGGTAEEGARRDIPEVAGEYFMLGRMPAYALYARNIRALARCAALFDPLSV